MDFKTSYLPSAPNDLSYERVLLRFANLTPGDEAKNFVPYYHFKVMLKDTQEEIGHINFRVGDNEHIRMVAGHIGYGISPAFRGKSLSFDACLAIAPFVRTVYERVLITADRDNLASLKILGKLKAEFLDQVAVPESDPQYAKSSRYKKRYFWKP